jgi:hypothetical protein
VLKRRMVKKVGMRPAWMDVRTVREVEPRGIREVIFRSWKGWEG